MYSPVHLTYLTLPSSGGGYISLCQYVCILYPFTVTYRIELFLSICGQYHYYSLGNIECYQFISQKIVFAVCALRVTFPYRSLFLVILTSSCLHFLLQREREREREREFFLFHFLWHFLYKEHLWLFCECVYVGKRCLSTLSSIFILLECDCSESGCNPLHFFLI